MQVPWTQAGAAFVVAVVSLLLLIATRQWHGKFTFDGSSGVQKFHTAPTPRIGGAGIYLALWVSLSFGGEPGQNNLLLLLVSALPAFLVGLIEDTTKDVRPRTRLMATAASGVLAWAVTGASIVDTDIQFLDLALAVPAVSVAFTAFAVAGVANAVNIVDGFNGLAGGVVLTMLAGLGFVAAAVGDAEVLALVVLLGASVAGFMVLNWPFGRIFLGDGGAYFLGFSVGWISVLLLYRNPAVSAWAPLVICGYPILEVWFSILRKSLRAGYSPSLPDRVHMHMLVHRRLARPLFRGFDRSLQNGLTSPFPWLYSAAAALYGAMFFERPGVLVAGLLGLGAIYWLIYLRLTQFRWCLKAGFGRARLVVARAPS